MSILERIFSRFLRFLTAPTAPNCTTVSPRDWADLPTYHPRCD